MLENGIRNESGDDVSCMKWGIAEIDLGEARGKGKGSQGMDVLVIDA